MHALFNAEAGGSPLWADLVFPISMPAAPPPPPKRPMPPLSPEHLQFHHLVDQLVELNKAMRNDEGRANPKAYTPATFATTFSTVRAFVGRTGGGSTYIRSRATRDDLIIVPSRRAKDREYTPRHTYATVMTPEVFAYGGRNMGRTFERYDKIYIDDPSYIFGEVEQGMIYHLLTHDQHQTFILLGA